MAKAYKLGQLAIDNTEVVKLKNDFVKYANKDVLKALTAFHREISKEVLKDSRTLGRKQNIPKGDRSVMGFTASGTRTEAKINIKTSLRNPSALSLEFGRRYVYVPVRGSGKIRNIDAAAVGKLKYSRPNARFRYKPWIGNKYQTGDSTFSQLGKQGYVVGKTIVKNQKEIADTYSDKMLDSLQKRLNSG
jgi:hypothetical protein